MSEVSDDPPDDPGVVIAKEVQYTARSRDAQHHRHRMAVTWSAIALIFVILAAALYQIFFVAEADWAMAAISSTLIAAVAFLFSRER